MAPPSWGSLALLLQQPLQKSHLLLHDSPQSNAIALVLPTYTSGHQVLDLNTVIPIQQSDDWSFGPLAKCTHHRDLYHKQLSWLEDLVLCCLDAVSSHTSLVLFFFLLKVTIFLVLSYLLQLFYLCSYPISKFLHYFHVSFLQFSSKHCCKPVHQGAASFTQPF